MIRTLSSLVAAAGIAAALAAAPVSSPTPSPEPLATLMPIGVPPLPASPSPSPAAN